ncbi:MAG: alginate lyase family protein [Rhodospirillales bacterium]|nr:alginate lyase family protein [Rhodospirillales bacterium]MBO6785994.1 alginate lyase family protein [Rhodospirillales bacterium]
MGISLPTRVPPPRAVARWLLRRLKARRTAKTLPGWERWLGSSSLAAALDQSDFDAVISAFRAANPFPALAMPAAVAAAIEPRSRSEILARADMAMRREVNFLGSGIYTLSTPVDWCLDFKSGTRWAMRASHRLPVNDPGNPSDIKIIWELSRLQWLLPVGQAYVLEQDESRAEFARIIIEEWLASNPVCAGPNWMCAMDVALRAISMIWLAQACKDSASWRDTGFQERLIKSLVLHARFIDGNLEYADINGNHLTADLAGLTVLGIALGGRGIAAKWIEKSWRLLCDEFPMQVPDDGVCREGSLPYHRLVGELFLLPALARRNVGLPVGSDYVARLRKMGRFTEAATQPDGEVAVWGDADDGRGLPLGTQGMNDHRYLAELMNALDSGPAHPEHDETLWWVGIGNRDRDRDQNHASAAFPNAGAYILRGDAAHVFVDAGPVGMAGRGGHGHNDCLSFSACMDCEQLIVDPGCYVYTSDYDARNRFRATGAHNTPCVDGAEINRFNPKLLWRLANDANPEIRHWSTSTDVDILVAAHSGYARLASPVTPVRGFMLERSTRRLFVADGFEGTGEHDVRIPYTFAPGCDVEGEAAGVWKLTRNGKKFGFIISAPEAWAATPVEAEYSPSYGVKQSVRGLVLSCSGTLCPVAVAIMPESALPPDPVRWLSGVVDGRFPVPGFKR